MRQCRVPSGTGPAVKTAVAVESGLCNLICISNEARRAIESLDLDAQERILAALESLQTDPFSGDVKSSRAKRES